ncbi:keratin, type I cytoskeletal 9 isoform X2 [Capsella rubella]|uniref:keratin, type I cytoskeletal 9 isoform X2 n=1 Tax=Capsella rubella TaxID=81985 RepID=UPI000CD5064D|nr:keratin, type I cytoskeletal 9 isoform X2 [Capsella rubella]
MDRYKRVDKPKPESPINENEIRITSQGLIRNYISYATSLLQEKGVKDIVLKAMGQAISKTVAISEILKNKIPGLHQDIAISSMSITDVWEPMEEGLVPVELTRHVSMISITLSLSELNKDSPGYQAPAQTDQSKPQYQPQQGKQARLPYNAYGEGDGEVVAEGEAGEEVDMKTTKGFIKANPKGTIKKIIKTLKAGIQTGAEAVDVVEGVMALVGGRGGYSGGRDDGYGGERNDGYSGGRNDGYSGGRNDGYSGGRNNSYGGGRNNSYGGGRNDGYGGGRNDGYGGGRNDSYSGGRNDGYGGRRGGFRGGRGGDRGDGYGGGREEGYGVRQGGYEGRGGGRGDGYGGGRGDGYGGGRGDGYEGGRGGYRGVRGGYGRGRGRMGNGGRSRGGASNQNQA